MLGSSAGLAHAHGGWAGGGQGLGGPTGRLLATSPWEVQGGRGEEPHIRVEPLINHQLPALQPAAH